MSMMLRNKTTIDSLFDRCVEENTLYADRLTEKRAEVIALNAAVQENFVNFSVINEETGRMDLWTLENLELFQDQLHQLLRKTLDYSAAVVELLGNEVRARASQE
jgi:hypothetical protein